MSVFCFFLTTEYLFFMSEVVVDQFSTSTPSISNASTYELPQEFPLKSKFKTFL